MDFFKIIDKRRSVRKFSNKTIPEEVIIKALNAALLAASILGLKYPKINKEILEYRKKQTKRVLKTAKLI